MKYFNYHRSTSNVVLSLSLFLFLSCGGSGSQNLVGFVTDVRVDPASVHLNELASVRVDFDSSQTANLSNDSLSVSATDVVLKIPPGVDYEVDTSEFDGSDVGGYRTRNPNHVEICSDGTRALTYSFSAGELTDNENSIRLYVKPYEGQGEVIFFALADDFISIPCNIFSEDFDQLLILP